MTSKVITLDGNIREEIGGSSAKKLRRTDRLPAVIYGTKDNENIYIDIDAKEFEKEYFKGGIEAKLFEIKTVKKTYNVVCYQIDLDPVSDRPRHIDFMSADDKQEVKVWIPIKYLNRDKAIGLKNGGYVNVLVRKLQVFCDPKNIPEAIEVECSKLRLKQSVKLSDLSLPNGVKPVSKKNLLLVRVIGRGKDTIGDDSATTAATTATTATTAATTATAQPQAKK